MEDGMQILSFSTLTAGTLLAASLTAVTASAADLPVRAAPPAAVYAPVASWWTGCYVGGNLGAAWGSREITTSVGTVSSSSSSAHFAGGGQVGCDYQTGAWVFGIRNMFDVADASARRTVQTGPFAGYSAELKNNWLDLLTGRIGYAAYPNWLLYFQGGAAWRKNSLTFFNPAGGEVFDASRTRTGWTIGVGTEWKFHPSWSAFVEYNHADFGTHSGTFNSAVLGPIALSAKSNTDLFLVGVNWRPSGGGY
jgi:outer membrane immunogenic protein